MLILSMHHTDQLVREIIETGAKGYISSPIPDRSLVAAVEARRFTSHFLPPARLKLCWKAFAPRERSPKFLKLFVTGLTGARAGNRQLLSRARAARKSRSSWGFSVKTLGNYTEPTSCESWRFIRSASWFATPCEIQNCRGIAGCPISPDSRDERGNCSPDVACYNFKRKKNPS